MEHKAIIKAAANTELLDVLASYWTSRSSLLAKAAVPQHFPRTQKARAGMGSAVVRHDFSNSTSRMTLGKEAWFSTPV